MQLKQSWGEGSVLDTLKFIISLVSLILVLLRLLMRGSDKQPPPNGGFVVALFVLLGILCLLLGYEFIRQKGAEL